MKRSSCAASSARGPSFPCTSKGGNTSESHATTRYRSSPPRLSQTACARWRAARRPSSRCDPVRAGKALGLAGRYWSRVPPPCTERTDATRAGRVLHLANCNSQAANPTLEQESVTTAVKVVRLPIYLCKRGGTGSGPARRGSARARATSLRRSQRWASSSASASGSTAARSGRSVLTACMRVVVAALTSASALPAAPLAVSDRGGAHAHAGQPIRSSISAVSGPASGAGKLALKVNAVGSGRGALGVRGAPWPPRSSAGGRRSPTRARDTSQASRITACGRV